MVQRHLEVPAEQIVFVDDRPDNITAALQLGIDAIKFEGAESLAEQLQARELL